MNYIGLAARQYSHSNSNYHSIPKFFSQMETNIIVYFKKSKNYVGYYKAVGIYRIINLAY